MVGQLDTELYISRRGGKTAKGLRQSQEDPVVALDSLSEDGCMGGTTRKLFPTKGGLQECLFASGRPMVALADEDHERGTQLLNRVWENSGNQRAAILVAAMVVEHHVTEILRAWLPCFGKYEKQERLSFSGKTNLLMGCGLVPLTLIDSIHALREIRNAFAHELVGDTVKEVLPLLKAEKRKRIRRGLREAGVLGEEDVDFAHVKSLVTTIHVFLRGYVESVQAVASRLRSGEFMGRVAAEVQAELEALPPGASKDADMKKQMLDHAKGRRSRGQ